MRPGFVFPDPDMSPCHFLAGATFRPLALEVVELPETPRPLQVWVRVVVRVRASLAFTCRRLVSKDIFILLRSLDFLASGLLT